ncbi:MAG: SLC13 family permease, partial [Chloroflexota bacterium]
MTKNLLASIKLDKRTIGVLVSTLIAALTLILPLPGGISLQARKTLAVTLVTVCWWVFEVMPPAYTTLMMLLAYILFGLAAPEAVFKIWTMPLMWMIISAFLIAAAVTRSGLAERVSYFFIIRFAGSYRSIIILTYVLGFLLSFLIPHPFPRSLLLMSLVRVICQKAGVNNR